MNNTTDIIQSIKLTSADKAAIKEGNAKLQQLNKTSEAFFPADIAITEGKVSGLLDRIYSTGDRFVESPTEENLAAHYRALETADTEQRHRRRLRDLGGEVVRRARQPLEGIAFGILDRAIAELDKQEESSRSAAEAAGLAGEHAAKYASLRAELEAQRESIRQNAGSWLASFGFEV